MKFIIRDIHLGQIQSPKGFENFLYAGGDVAELLQQRTNQPSTPSALSEKGIWFVNPSFYQIFLSGTNQNVSIIEERSDWILTAISQIFGQHLGCPVFLGTSDDRGNFVTCELNDNFPPNRFSTSLRLYEKQSRTQAALSAKRHSGTIAILDWTNGRDFGEIEQFLNSSGIAHSPRTVKPSIHEGTALSNLTQLAQIQLSIENRTHYRTGSRAIPWFTNGEMNRRSGLMLSTDAQATTMLEFLASEPHLEPLKVNRQQFLITSSGDTAQQLLEQLDQIALQIEQDAALNVLEQKTSIAEQATTPCLRVCLVANTGQKLMDEIEQAKKGVASAMKSGKEWQSRGGSYFTPKPLGEEAKIAFVYPGAFNSYIGMGAELMHCFPSLHDWLAEHNDNPSEIYQAKNLFPPSWGNVSDKQLEDMQLKLLNHPLSMLFSGTAIAGMYTHLLRQLFDIQPDAAYGYSLGEIMMFFATDYWKKTEPIKKEITESDLYKNRIAGSMDAVREFWDEMGYAYNESEIIWNNMILMTNLEKVKAAVEKEPLVYLTHVNTHRQVVIGGEPQACQRVVSELGCMRFPIPVNYPMHCAPVASEFDVLQTLNLQPVEEPASVKFYSSYNCGPYTLESTAIAETVAGGLVNQVDFDALTKRVFDDGYSFFIEVGARSNCSKWIERSLKSKEFCAVSVNQAEIDDEICLMKVIARLVSHGKKVNLPLVNHNGALV